MIKEMNDAGYPVFITHRRILKETGHNVITYNNSRARGMYGPKPEYNACGGSTTVYIGEFNKPFVAKCSNKDHFCFKDGTFLAVSRAYAYFKEHCVESEQGASIQQEFPQSKSCCGGQCCSGITENEDGTYEMVLKADTRYGIVCINPKNGEFIGYLPKNDAYVTGKYEEGPIKLYEGLFDANFYTDDVKEAAEFDTCKSAEKALVHQEEHVIQIDYKLIGRVTVTEL